MNRFIGLLILLAAGIGAYFSVSSVLWQHQANRTFVAVPAQIVNTEVREHRGNKGGRTYSPEATYTYDFQGGHYRSTRVLAVSVSTSSRSWAQGVLGRIARTAPGGPEGGGFASTAYVNPRNPTEAVLVRDYSFFPYAFGMGTLLAAAVGAGMVAGVVRTSRTKMAAVALDDSGWQLLLPQIQLHNQLRNAVFWLIGGGIVIVLMPAHWLLVAGQTGLPASISSGIALAFIVALAIVAFRRWSVARHVSDARLRVKPAPVPRGAPFAMEVGIDAYAPLHVTQMNARVLCIEHYKESRGTKTHYGTRTRGEKSVMLCGPGVTPAGQEIAGTAELTLEQNLPPTTDITIKSYPYYTWEIRLKLALEGMVDYAATFPLEVD
jgi:hypothetical protein